MAAHNNSNGRQNLALGDGDMNSVNDHGVQVIYNFNMPPYLWPLVKEEIDSRSGDREPYHAILTKWLTQQSGQPAVTPRHYHLDLLSQATPETGTWVLSRKEFQRWKDVASPDRILFMSGIRKKRASLPSTILLIKGVPVGSGKTVLMSIIIDALEKQSRHTQDTICVYLFFHERDATAASAASIWANLVLQLLQKEGPGGIADELKSEFGDCFHASRALHHSKYLKLFTAQATTFKTVYLVIDGLYNCPDLPEEETQKQVLNAIKDLPRNVRTLVSSRTGLEGRDFKNSQTLCVKPHNADVAAYIKGRIEGDTSLCCILKEHQKIDWVVHSVTTLASTSRMFLLARLHLDTLRKQNTMDGIDIALSQLPDNLDDAFEGAIRQIGQKTDLKRDLASHVLTWIVYAKTHLTIGEIQDSYAFTKSEGDSWHRGRPPRDLLVSACAGLVVEDDDKGVLRLVHESVKSHLENSNLLYEKANLAIAKTCLTCLLADGRNGDFDTCLLEYASNHWTHHCLDDQTTGPEMEDQIQEFLFSRSKLARAFGAIPEVPGLKVDGMTGLHAAVFYNLTTWAKKIINGGVKVNAQCSDGQTALHWAVTLGRRQFVKYLIRKGAKPNIADLSGDTPIHKCLSESSASSLDIVQSLIEGRAKLNIKGARGLTPLSSAIRYGPTSVAALLIKGQGDVNAEIIMPGWTSLKELFNHGHEMVHSLNKTAKSPCRSSTDRWDPLKRAIDDHVRHLMQLLLDKGADLNRPTEDNWLPLIHAVKTGRVKTLQCLLEREPNPANVNLRDPDSGRSPLWLAFRYKRSSIVRQLVEHGSDINEKNDDGWTPLIEAVQNNDRDLVWLLLKKRAQPNTFDGNGWSALHYAIKGRNKDITWLLLTKGASVKAQAKGTPAFLHLALSANDLSVAWLLHEHGADINATDDLGTTALHKACHEGNLPHVRFLLDMGAKIDMKDATKSTPLHHSVLRDLEDAVELLASRTSALGGLDEQDAKSNTALMLATMLGKRKMVESLLRYGASCDVQDQEGLTALHHAANQGFNDGLRLLVAKSNDINLADKKGYTALHHAVNGKGADIETVDILCAGGADLSIRQEDGYLPWTLALSLKKEKLAHRLAIYATRGQSMKRQR